MRALPARHMGVYLSAPVVVRAEAAALHADAIGSALTGDKGGACQRILTEAYAEPELHIFGGDAEDSVARKILEDKQKVEDDFRAKVRRELKAGREERLRKSYSGLAMWSKGIADSFDRVVAEEKRALAADSQADGPNGRPIRLDDEEGGGRRS